MPCARQIATSTNESVAPGADCHHDRLCSHRLPYHRYVPRASPQSLYPRLQDTAFLCILDGVLRVDAGTSPLTEFKEETDRVLAERVETGHWQTLSTTDAGVTEKWIPATPATDMVMPKNARSIRLPHSCCPCLTLLRSLVLCLAHCLFYSLIDLLTAGVSHYCRLTTAVSRL